MDALCRVSVGEGYSNLVLDAALKEAGLSPADNGLAAALFYGTLERRITLDYYLKDLAKGRISPYVREALRMGLYQILYMDKIPDAAAVSETVELVKHSRESRAAGLCNAVLRGALRRREELSPPQGHGLEALSVRYACPAWLVQNLIGDYGLAFATDFLEDALQPPPVYIRVNTLRISPKELVERLRQAGLRAEAGPEGASPEKAGSVQVDPAGMGPAGAGLLEGCIRMDGAGAVEKNPLYLSGLFHVQDAASQYCAALLDPRPGERALDLCAAPGGKSFTLAQRMEDRGMLVSCDLHEQRVGLIRKGAGRLGITCLSPRQNDGAAYNPGLLEGAAGGFDKVLCDVPCSGFGIIRRKPDVKYKEPDSLKALPALQLAILENGSRYVGPGGRLVYSTCTLRRAENQKVCARFLKAHPEFVLEERAGFRSALADDPPGFYTFTPASHGSDGFFAAVFRRAAFPKGGA